MFAVNVRGAYNVTRRLAPGMAERGFGRIVFLSSVSAERGGGVFGGVAYSAAKAPARVRPRAGPRAGPERVTVNSVAPGLIDTDITAGKLVGETEKQLLAGVPVGRNGKRHDVADLITYLCREESGYITGATCSRPIRGRTRRTRHPSVKAVNGTPCQLPATAVPPPLRHPAPPGDCGTPRRRSRRPRRRSARPSASPCWPSPHRRRPAARPVSRSCSCVIPAPPAHCTLAPRGLPLHDSHDSAR